MRYQSGQKQDKLKNRNVSGASITARSCALSTYLEGANSLCCLEHKVMDIIGKMQDFLVQLGATVNTSFSPMHFHTENKRLTVAFWHLLPAFHYQSKS